MVCWSCFLEAYSQTNWNGDGNNDVNVVDDDDDDNDDDDEKNAVIA